MGKNAGRHLQYGPRTRLVRGIYSSLSVFSCILLTCLINLYLQIPPPNMLSCKMVNKQPLPCPLVFSFCPTMRLKEFKNVKRAKQATKQCTVMAYNSNFSTKKVNSVNVLLLMIWLFTTAWMVLIRKNIKSVTVVHELAPSFRKMLSPQFSRLLTSGIAWEAQNDTGGHPKSTDNWKSLMCLTAWELVCFLMYIRRQQCYKIGSSF